MWLCSGSVKIGLDFKEETTSQLLSLENVLEKLFRWCRFLNIPVSHTNVSNISAGCGAIYPSCVHPVQSLILIFFFFFLISVKGLLTKRRVSKCHGLMVVRLRKIFLTLRKILRFLCANLFFYTSFTIFASFFTHIMWLLVWFFNFLLRKFSKLTFWPRKKSTFRTSD